MATPANWTDISSLDAEKIVALGNRYLPGIITLVLVLLLGWQLARIVWMLVPASPLGDPIAATPPAGVASTSATARSVNVEQIASTHLFGEARAEDAVAVPLPAPTEELEETRLALTLKGTMAGSDDRLTVAIIADNRNEEKVYAIGDAVVAGATLHAVYRDQVVLNRSGILESLKLPKDMPTNSAPIRRATTTRTSAPVADSSPSLQQALTENAARLTDVIRPTPYFVGGQQQGYRVYPGRDRKAFAALGLRPGDLIKDIDGAALTDPQQAMEIFQNLGTADQVSVTVERNGQPQVLTLTTSQISLADEDELD
jgi:general secretion pathway protein C